VPALLPNADHAPVTARCDEEAETVHCCANLHATLSEELRTRQYKRGLVIEYTGDNFWGLGQLMVHLFMMHYVCRVVKRFCYVRIYDSELEKVLGYSNGLRFSPDEAELARYPNESTYNVTTGNEHRAWSLKHPERFAAMVENDSAALVRGAFPGLPATLVSYESLPVLPWDHAWTQKGVRAIMDPCFLRFVCAPVGLSCVGHSDEPKAAAAPGPHVYHLRTGAADIPDEDQEPANRSATREWLYAACPRLLEPRRATDPPLSLISDSPGLVDFFRSAEVGEYDREHQRPRGGGQLGGGPIITRTWNGTHDGNLQAAHDIVCAARGASALFASVHSSYPRQLAATAICPLRMERHDDNRSGSLCPHADFVFVRDMYTAVLHAGKNPRMFAGKRVMRYSELQRRFIPEHPCKTLDREACRVSYVSALAG